ncbi:hypothetical protein IAI18_10595 [Acetobacteraceae bacterium H6797]|nr:hypothetical protein [Acetobacteraceae bacterium H6797]
MLSGFMKRLAGGEKPAAQAEAPQKAPDGLDDEAVKLLCRLFLGHEVVTPGEIERYRQLGNAKALAAHLAGLPGAIRPPGPYRMPLFLLQPPSDPAIPWRFEPPSLIDPVSQLCTAGQFDEPTYEAWCEALKTQPNRHRKLWEFVFILAVLEKDGLLRRGVKGLGFGTGLEPLPSLFAARGVKVLATDAPVDIEAGSGWTETGQHSQSVEQLYRKKLVRRPVFDKLVSFRPIDMNAIPPDLDDFDFCWSACCFEHLGSIRHGLEFVENSLGTLRPGGLAIHTTEFNLDSNDRTMERKHLSIFRRKDIEALYSRLTAAGHEVWPLNLHPGFEELDAHVDLPPYALPHLKLEQQGITVTSIGLVVRKKGKRRVFHKPA